jgi:hypothetical protein
MDYMAVLAASSAVVLPLLGGLAVTIYFLRRDILRTLGENDGKIEYGSKPVREKRLVNKAPRVIDDETAYRIEQEQTQRNARDYR